MGEKNETSVDAMEMVKEENNQPKITPKRIKVEEIVEEDRISALPDGLLLEILSRLPSTESAIRTGSLSKRWEYLWTLVPTLILEHKFDNRPRSDFVSFVNKTLTQCRQLKVSKFVVNFLYDIQFESQVNNWIHYVTSCNVEVLYLSLLNLDFKAVFPLDEYFFINSSFTDLRLTGCILNATGPISWKSLRILYICFGNLDEDLIENILSGSPLLEALVLDECYGYRKLDITSKSVRILMFMGYMHHAHESDEVADTIEINAPNITALSIEGGLRLWKLSLLDVSSVVEADLDYSLRGAHYDPMPKEVEEEMLKGFIQSLRNVKELELGVSCSKVLSRLEDKGFIVPSNVEFLDVAYSYYDSLEQGDWYSVESGDWNSDSDNNSLE